MKSSKLRLLTVFSIALLGIASIDNGWTKSVDDKFKDFIDDVSGSLKESVDRLGDNLAAVQDYLEHYPWKGLIQDQSSSGAVTLAHLQLNGHAKVVAVKPGERIEGIVQCNLDREQCSSMSLYRVILGIKGKGAQTTIGNEFGIFAGESLERFSLIAPTEPGFYEVRFKLVNCLLQQTALDAWKDKDGNEPDGTTTIGIIFVQS